MFHKHKLSNSLSISRGGGGKQKKVDDLMSIIAKQSFPPPSPPPPLTGLLLLEAAPRRSGLSPAEDGASSRTLSGLRENAKSMRIAPVCRGGGGRGCHRWVPVCAHSPAHSAREKEAGQLTARRSQGTSCSSSSSSSSFSAG